MRRGSQTAKAEAGRQIRPASSITPLSPASAPFHPILQLQRTVGNQEVERLLSSPRLQAKLAISQPGNVYEQEADRIAERVMRMPAPVIQRTCSACATGDSTCSKCETEKQELVQRKTEQVSDSSGSIPDDFLQSLGPGQPLDSATRAFFEPRFGADLSGVRLHTGGEAVQLNRAINAQAFTQGRDIYLGEGKDDLESSAGKQLLAHELTHTIQQGGAGTFGPSVQRARLSEAGGGLIQRDADDPAATGDFNVPTLDQLYNQAVQAARQTGNWQDAAEKLNGFNREDIQSRLAQLTSDEVGYLHLGALDNPRVGPDSQVAQMTKPGTPPASTPPPSATHAPAVPLTPKPVPVSDGAEKSVAEMTNFEKLSRAIYWAEARQGRRTAGTARCSQNTASHFCNDFFRRAVHRGTIYSRGVDSRRVRACSFNPDRSFHWSTCVSGMWRPWKIHRRNQCNDRR